MNRRVRAAVFAAAAFVAATSAATLPSPAIAAPDTYPLQEGFVDANGVFIYYTVLGHGTPLMILHGGPGASHDYFLPYLLPLARHHRLVFIDERGSGKSGRLEDPRGYTVEAMVEDVEAVRQALGLGRVDLLGHSYGGVLAQAYAFAHQDHLAHLILGSTFHSTRELNRALARMKRRMPADLRQRIDQMEAKGLYGHGKPYERGRYSQAYQTAAWGEAYFPYLYRARPDASYDPTTGAMSWELYREMWGSHGEFVIDGNLASVEYADQLPSLRVPTLITVGDHDLTDPTISREMQRLIPGARLVVFPNSGHMTFVDQPEMFLQAVDEFLSGAAGRSARP